MSSQAVRDIIVDFIQTSFPAEKLVDLTAEYQDINDLIKAYNIGPKDPWLAVQFVGSEENPIDIAANNVQGKYRESGIINLHVVEIVKLGMKSTLIPRADAVRKALRGKRLGELVVKRVGPPITGVGATLSFSGGYTAALVEINYDYDFFQEE
jgi:hypothetical protein